jgi:hypothetical protein
MLASQAEAWVGDAPSQLRFILLYLFYISIIIELWIHTNHPQTMPMCQ